MSVVVAHPGRQHSHQLAVALAERGLLGCYWTGIPTSWPGRPPTVARLLNAVIKYERVNLDPEKVTLWPWSPAAQQAARRLFPESVQIDVAHRSFEWFDRWSARRLARSRGVAAVVAYENASLETFRVCGRQGMLRILDAASFHHRWQDRLYGFGESLKVHARICRRKDAELAHVDHVLTVSELARESYLDAGVPASNVTAVHVGCDLQLFRPVDSAALPCRNARFLFAGHASAIKGIDLLIAAFQRMRHAGVEYEFVVAGHVDNSCAGGLAAVGSHFLGRITQQRLAAEMRLADCLLLPSRFDSFGMVVVEALASGLPVVVSSMVGAKEAVTEGESGWVVPVGDTEALASRVRWCANNVSTLRAMRARARQDALAYDWATYRARVADVIGQLLHDGCER
jgi:glycosyltransferase involved in cell wall biosynthesis